MLGLLKLSAGKSRNVEPTRHSLPLGIKANDAQSEPIAGRGGLVTLNIVCRVKKLDVTIRSRQVRQLAYPYRRIWVRRDKTFVNLTRIQRI